MSQWTDVFQTLSDAKRLDSETFRGALETILRGEADPAQISAFLLGLNMVGITTQELRIGTEVMRQHMQPVSVVSNVIDIVGTGGTGLHTLSISTACAIVVAGAGAHVAKHGNRAASSLTGTADTLSELGVNLAITPRQATECIETIGLGFLFAPNHHPAMRNVGAPRKALAVKTLFNLLGPLCNPAHAKRQLLGVSQDRWRRPMADALNDLGSTHVWVVHGEDGLDEITTTGKTFISELKDGAVKDFVIHPDDFNLATTNIEALRGGAPHDNAAALRALLDGERGPYRDIVLLNSGVALMIAGEANSIEEGLAKAASALDTGQAAKVLANLVETTQGFKA